jgi:AraC-like DNA-binding protein
MILAEHIENLYSHILQQLRLKIEADFGTLEAFSKQAGISRTSLSKVFSDNIQRDMTIGMYTRILIGLKLVPRSRVLPESLHTRVTVKEYLTIDNNTIINSITLISNDLWTT